MGNVNLLKTFRLLQTRGDEMPCGICDAALGQESAVVDHMPLSSADRQPRGLLAGDASQLC